MTLLGKEIEMKRMPLLSGLFFLLLISACKKNDILLDENNVLLANPADVFRILNIFSLDDVRTLYGLATVFPRALANPWMLGLVMLAWIAAPLGIATWRFRK